MNADPDRKGKACSFEEFGVWIQRKIKYKILAFEASDYLDTEAREKNNDLLFEHMSTNAVFQVEMLRKEIELMLAQN